MKNSNKIFAIGSDFVSSIIVGVLIGVWLDNHFQTKPWLLIIFFFLGVISGFWSVIRTVKKFEK